MKKHAILSLKSPTSTQKKVIKTSKPDYLETKTSLFWKQSPFVVCINPKNVYESNSYDFKTLWCDCVVVYYEGKKEY
jgi:hypothetical protein